MPRHLTDFLSLLSNGDEMSIGFLKRLMHRTSVQLRSSRSQEKQKKLIILVQCEVCSHMSLRLMEQLSMFLSLESLHQILGRLVQVGLQLTVKGSSLLQLVLCGLDLRREASAG